MKADRKALVLSALSITAGGIVIYLGALLFLTFVEPLVWAGLIAFLVWPVHERLAHLVKSPAISAFIISLSILLVVATIIIPASVRLVREATNIYQFLSDDKRVMEYVEGISQVEIVRSLISSNLLELIKKNLSELTQKSKQLLFRHTADFGMNFMRSIIFFLFFIVFVFFILKDAQKLIHEMSKGLKFLSGTKFSELWEAINDSLHSALIGGLLTATIQGSLAGIGYVIFNAPYPVIFTILTIIAGTIPFTPPLVFTPVGLWVLFMDDFTNGLLLLIYCWTVVNVSDPLIRPILVGRGIKMPTGLMFIGVLGGVANFGLMGIFVGPMIMAILRVFWIEFTKEETNNIN